MNAQFITSQIITLKSSEVEFKFSGLNALKRELENARIKENMSQLPHEIKARVYKVITYDTDEKCCRIEVEWLHPYHLHKNLNVIGRYEMYESEFKEFELQFSSDFPVGSWVYYLGGCDTEYWKPGVVGKISEITHDCYRFDNKLGDLYLGGANDKRFFRLANTAEIKKFESLSPELKTGDWAYYMGKEAGGLDNSYWKKGMIGKIDRLSSSGECYVFKNGFGTIVGGGSNSKKAFRLATQSEIDSVNIHGNPCAEIKLNPIVLKEEIELSFTSTKLIANNINNSKEVENFLLMN